MRVTVGISSEREVAYAELVSFTELGAETVRRVELVANGAALGSVLDHLAAGVVEDIEDVAVVYRTVEQRRAMVAELAEGPWCSSSMVSVRSALLAAVQNARELDDFATVAAFELSGEQVTFVVVGPERDRALVGDALRPGAATTAGIVEAIAHVWRKANVDDIQLDAALVCGVLVDDSVVAAIRRLGPPNSQIAIHHVAGAALRGAAVVAASEHHDTNIAAPEDTSHTARGPLLVFGLAVVVAVVGAVVVRMDTGMREASASAGPTSTDAPPSLSVPETPAAATESASESTSPTTSEPAPITDSSTQDSSPEMPPPMPSTTVSAPNGEGLFPGETLPPIGADQAAWDAWWENHTKLKNQWLNGG
ncbi:hypothetical protein [Nocardia sp. NPDC052566]|uniref:hypothetical protein n=1 Tax=Nocardia sp. NPDC052566 TaxID=3364330 RepID=UPI0037CC77FC